jgi:hypothetical protein
MSGDRKEGRHARSHLPRARHRGFRAFRALRRGPEAHLMLADLIWGAGAILIAGYMLFALLRPEKF